jgi:hypothetical protein
MKRLICPVITPVVAMCIRSRNFGPASGAHSPLGQNGIQRSMPLLPSYMQSKHTHF